MCLVPYHQLKHTQRHACTPVQTCTRLSTQPHGLKEVKTKCSAKVCRQTLSWTLALFLPLKLAAVDLAISGKKGRWGVTPWLY